MKQISLAHVTGFRSANHWTDYFWAMLAGSACPAISVWMLIFLGVDVGSAPTELDFFTTLLSIFFISFYVPITEEFLFRGPVWTILEDVFKFRPITVALLTVFPFMIAHADPEHIVGIIPISMTLTWLRERSGSIYPTILCHAVNNGIIYLAIIALYLLS